MKHTKTLYRISSSLFILSMVGGATMYFLQYPSIKNEFAALGFPSFIIYPLAIAKILGSLTILQENWQQLREWAYAGFTFQLTLAAAAHYAVADGEFFIPLIVLCIMGLSYYFDKKRKADYTVRSM